METHFLLIAIDPGNDTGWAIFEDGNLVHSGLIDGNDFEGVKRLLSYKPQNVGQKFLLVESQFLRNNPSTLIKLVQKRAGVETIGRFLGFEVYNLKPSTWQSTILPRNTKGTKNTKERAMIAVRDAVGLECTFEDQADAICMGLHFVETREKGLSPEDVYTPTFWS